MVTGIVRGGSSRGATKAVIVVGVVSGSKSRRGKKGNGNRCKGY